MLFMVLLFGFKCQNMLFSFLWSYTSVFQPAFVHVFNVLAAPSGGLSSCCFVNTFLTALFEVAVQVTSNSTDGAYSRNLNMLHTVTINPVLIYCNCTL